MTMIHAVITVRTAKGAAEGVHVLGLRNNVRRTSTAIVVIEVIGVIVIEATLIATEIKIVG